MADLTYLGPDPSNPDAHQVLGGDGNVYTVPLSGLPPDVQTQAVNQAQQNLGPSPAGAPAAGDTFPAGKSGAGIVNMFQKPGAPSLTAIAKGGEYAPPSYGDTSAPAPAAPPPPPPAATDDTQSAQPAVIPTPTQPAMGGGGGGSTGNGDEAIAMKNAQAGGARSLADANAETNAQYQLDKRAGREDTTLLGQQSQEQGQRLNDFQAWHAKAQAQAQDMMTKARAIQDDFANSSIPAFPQNVGSRIMNALAFMTSGIGSGITGKDNMAAKEHTDQVNNWLATQKFNIEHKKEAAQGYMDLSQKFIDLGNAPNVAFQMTDEAYKKKAALDAEKLVAARGDPQAMINFLKNNKVIADDYQKTQLETAKAVSAQTLQRAQAGHENAATRHENAETAALGVTGGVTAAARTGQQNMANKVPFMSLPPDQQQGLLRTAQQNGMLLPGVGIAQRKVEPDEVAQMRDLDTARSLIGDLDQMTKSTTLNPMQQAAAASKAQTLQALLPKVLGSQARLSPASEQALGNIIPAKPGRWFEPWQAESKAIRSTLGEVQAPLEKSMGLTRFRPLAPPKNQKPVG